MNAGAGKEKSGARREPGQTELFPESPPAPEPVVSPAPSPVVETPREQDTAPGRIEALEVLLAACAPVRAGSAAANWLKQRRVFKRTWDAQGLRVVENYRRATEELLARFTSAQLSAWGLFNREGHLRFYRHTLLVPWLDAGRPVWLQAHAPDETVVPPRITIAGPPPCPYNAHLLDGAAGRLYLCAGILDALPMAETGVPVVAAAEDGLLRPEWLPRFAGKSVYVAYDGDADGEAAASKAVDALAARGVEAHRLQVPAGKDVGQWLAGR